MIVGGRALTTEVKRRYKTDGNYSLTRKIVKDCSFCQVWNQECLCNCANGQFGVIADINIVESVKFYFCVVLESAPSLQLALKSA